MIGRYLRSLSAALVLPGETYVQASLDLCRGLQFSSSFAMAAHALLSNCPSIRYDSDERLAYIILLTHR